MQIHGAVAVITGGKRIGRAVAVELAARGADLVLTYHSSRREAEATVADVQARGRRATTIAADVARAEDCRAVIEHAVATFGRLDILVNMASIYRAVPFDELTEAAWDEDQAVNLRAAFLCSHAAVPHMRRAGGGRIVNISDWLAKSGRPRYRGYTAYYVAKAGVIALTETLALELARDRILVNAIAPGPITPPPDMTPKEIEDVARVTPLGRWGGEQEIAKVVIALIESDYVTGETIRVDGGRHVE
jgi:NAD(P)-dependent dehydrogenase (short-subunit alcohol dehydrogenase family)